VVKLQNRIRNASRSYLTQNTVYATCGYSLFFSAVFRTYRWLHIHLFLLLYRLTRPRTNSSPILWIFYLKVFGRSLKLREELRLSVFENTVLRRIFGSTGDEERGEWRKQQRSVPFTQHCSGD